MAGVPIESALALQAAGSNQHKAKSAAGPATLPDHLATVSQRALRRWIAADEARLRLLLGGSGGRNGADQSSGAAAAGDQ